MADVAINRKLKTSLAVLGLLLTVGATAAQEGGYRQPDSFYEPPAEVPATPGALLKSEPFTGIEIPKGAQAWRIQYAATFADGSPAVSVATVLAPVNMPEGARPVITYEHGTAGAQLRCMQSLWPAPFSRIPAAEQAIAEGWVVVATDYAFDGLHGPHPYGIGEGETRSELDAVRAAKKMPELKLDDRTVVWGHSQGGHSALWTAILGASYAPELKILGAAAIASVTNFARTVEMHAEKDDMPVAATMRFLSGRCLQPLLSGRSSSMTPSGRTHGTWPTKYWIIARLSARKHRPWANWAEARRKADMTRACRDVCL